MHATVFLGGPQGRRLRERYCALDGVLSEHPCVGCHLTDLVDTPMLLSPVRHRFWSFQLQLYLTSLCPLCRYLGVLLVACAVSGAYAGRGAQMRNLQAKSDKVLTVEQAYNDQVPFCFLTANHLIGW